MPRSDVLIIGAGLAGLAAAIHLHRRGLNVQILEASDGAGGRVRSDAVDGFVLDRGFQVLLTAYPEARSMLDMRGLDLRAFFPGALLRHDGRFTLTADPWRRPLRGMRTMFAPIGSLTDKFRVSQLRRAVVKGSIADLELRPETTTIDALRLAGISETMIDRFFRPFYGGIMLDRDLQTSSRIFDFTFRMFALGDTAIPAAGIGAISEQLASALPAGCIRLHARVSRLIPGGVLLEDGEELAAEAVIVATDLPSAAALIPGFPDRPSRSVTCMYFDAPEDPVGEPILVLNPRRGDVVNNLCVPSRLSSALAPAGRALVSVTVIGIPQLDDAELERTVRAELTGWYGSAVSTWRHLRTYRILHAHPAQLPPTMRTMERPVTLSNNRYVCGDHRDTASIHGALLSGRRAAEALCRDHAVV